MNRIPISSTSPPGATLLVLEFGISADGLRVARVGDTAFAMVSKAAGQFFLASGGRQSKPLAEWKGQGGRLHGGTYLTGHLVSVKHMKHKIGTALREGEEAWRGLSPCG